MAVWSLTEDDSRREDGRSEQECSIAGDARSARWLLFVVLRQILEILGIRGSGDDYVIYKLLGQHSKPKIGHCVNDHRKA